jgi:hypothetical protein
MANYHFRYADHTGAAIRNTMMQCAQDEDAIIKAREIMTEPYAVLEIFEDERPVYHRTLVPC